MEKTVLITGTSSGIGRATARLFAARGWNVVATMRRPDFDSELALLDNVFIAELDVRDRKSIDLAIQAGIACFGKIDVLVNNAGFGLFGLFEATSRAKILEQFDVNVFGVMDVTRAILPHFRRNRGGLVLNIGSDAGIFTLPMISGYCASKFALEGFTEALSYELASQNIGVKLVIPQGGIGGTNFAERSHRERAIESSLTDYRDFVGHTSQELAGMVAAQSLTDDDVAEVIYDAATDGTDRLRYQAGDDYRDFVRARQEMADQEYVEFMRSRFLATK